MKYGCNPLMIFLWLNVLFGCVCLMNCSTTTPKEHPKAKVKDLDSLNRIAEHKDSVESNTIFYEEAYQEYRKLFPGVDKSMYLHLAKGKDQEFCLFKPNPVKTCLETGDKFNDLNLKPPAHDAYAAGLLSEGYNDSAANIRLWGSMGQLFIEEKDYEMGRYYLMKLLEVDNKNKWAKKLLASIPKN